MSVDEYTFFPCHCCEDNTKEFIEVPLCDTHVKEFREWLRERSAGL